MPSACAGAPWAPRAARSGPAASRWERRPGATGAASLPCVPAPYAEAPARDRAPVAAARSAAAAAAWERLPSASSQVLDGLRLHAMRTSQARLRDVPLAMRAAVLTARHREDGRVTDTPVLVWRRRIPWFDLGRPLPPPPPYVPPYPLIVEAHWSGLALRPLPCITDYTAIPTPAWTGRMLMDWRTARWAEAKPAGPPLRLPWAKGTVVYGGQGGIGDETPWEGGWTPIIIPRRHWYMILHDITVVRLPDRLPLAVSRIALSIDAAQWAWTLSMDLLGEGAAALVEPTGSDPVQVEISINGAVWVCLIETWGQAQRWGALTTYQVKGRSLSALLSPVYVRPRSYAEASDLEMVQLAEQELPYGGGWAMTWTAGNWPVPAGAWTYQELSPIQAIARLAAAAGGLVAPGRDGKTLAVRPIYRVLPWDLSPGMEDMVVPASAILELNKQYRWPDQANAVYVYGAEAGGIQAQVYRAGSAADEPAADRLEGLLTHVDGARALGGRILAGLTRPAGVTSITLPVDARADFEVPELGDLIKVDVDGGQFAPLTSIGISVTVRGDAVQARQTLGLGEQRNDYQRLLSYLPRDPRILGQIASVSANGTAAVELLNGGTTRVRHRGIGTTGSWVWIRSGQVEAEAPALSAYAVDV